jgi:hypothetical protein
LEGRITAEDRAEWVKGSIEDWVLEGHRLAQTAAYGTWARATRQPSPPSVSDKRTADRRAGRDLERVRA